MNASIMAANDNIDWISPTIALMVSFFLSNQTPAYLFNFSYIYN
jgi:hypothetical protein